MSHGPVLRCSGTCTSTQRCETQYVSK
jgi:hypothetical protein